MQYIFIDSSNLLLAKLLLMFIDLIKEDSYLSMRALSSMELLL